MAFPDLPDVLDFFLLNWADQVEMENGYLTDVTQADDSLSEERRGLLERPYRSIRMTYQGMSLDEISRLWAVATRAGHERLVVPLQQDALPVTATSSGTEIFCTPTTRRFYAGARVIMWDAPYGSNVQYGVIDNVQSDRVVLTSSISGSYGTTASIAPLIHVENTLENAMEMFSAESGEFVFETEEVVGETALPASESGDPTGFTLYNGDPIFDIPHNWAESFEVLPQRQGAVAEQGRGVIVSLRGARPSQAFAMDILTPDRTEWQKVLNFFDTRLGRLRPYWFVWPTHLWTAQAVATTHVDIDPIVGGNIEDLQDFLSYVNITQTDGTVLIREISSIVDNTTYWRITFDAVIPSITLSQIEKTVPAFHVRMRSDAMTETWYNDGTVGVEWQMIEVQEEKNVEISEEDFGNILGASALEEIVNDQPTGYTSGGGGHLVCRERSSGRLWTAPQGDDGLRPEDRSVWRSDDEGVSWDAEGIYSQPAENGKDAVGLLFLNSGKLVHWSYDDEGSNNRIVFYRRDGNDTTPNWNLRSSINLASGTNMDDCGNIIVQTDDDRIHVFILNGVAIEYYSSTNDCDSWSTESTDLDTDNITSWFAILAGPWAFHDGNTVYLLYQMMTTASNPDKILRLVTIDSSTQAVTDTEDVPWADGDTVGEFQIRGLCGCVDNGGDIHVTWSWDDAILYNRRVSGTWRTNAINIVTFPSPDPRNGLVGQNSIYVDKQNRIYVGWIFGTSAGCQITVSLDGGATFAAPETLIATSQTAFRFAQESGDDHQGPFKGAAFYTADHQPAVGDEKAYYGVTNNLTWGS